MSKDTSDPSHITGNVPDDVKRALGFPDKYFTNNNDDHDTPTSPTFGEAIHRRLKVTEMSIYNKAEEPSKLEVRVVIEIVVADDMLNGGGQVHGACSAFLIDIGTTIALHTLTMVTMGVTYPSVSQSLNIVFHSPAELDETIRIVNTTSTLGARSHSARAEIWNVTKHRLVSSGVHIKMLPSQPSKALL